MKYENKDNILQYFQSIHDADERAELEDVYHKAEAWDKLKEKTIKVIDTIKAGKNRDVMSAVSAGVLSGIINYMNKVDEESKEDIEDARI